VAPCDLPIVPSLDEHSAHDPARQDRFLVDEILAEVRKTYRITDDPDGWVIAGFSSGGIWQLHLAFSGYDHQTAWGDNNHSLGHGGAVFPETMHWLWRGYTPDR